jgi:hypothetical protein
MRFLFKNLLLNLHLFIFVRVVFQKFCFFTDIVADMAVRYTVLCAPTVATSIPTLKGDSNGIIHFKPSSKKLRDSAVSP